MAWPWFCSTCSVWQPGEYEICPTCGRSAKGRLCRKCKKKVPGHAVFCTGCGGDVFLEPATKKLQLTRGQRVVVGAAAVAAAGALVWILPQLVTWTLGQLFNVGVYLAIQIGTLWLLTAFLPEGLRTRLRAGAWWCVKTLWKLICNLFH